MLEHTSIFVKKNWLLILIFLLAILLRFYKLGISPPSLDWDEAADGYNAYSILKTSKDEYGYKLPIYFRSFDDYKPPLYTYMTIPSVAAFGLNDFAVRFPSALLGVLAVLFTYLMTQELFKNKNISQMAAFFLAISPWHVQFTRVAFESVSVVFFTTAATWTFLKALKSNSYRAAILFTLAAILFGANLYLYHSARIFTPLYCLVLLFLFKNELLRKLKLLILSIVLSIILLSPLLKISTSTAGLMRFHGTSIFSDTSLKELELKWLEQDTKDNLSAIGKIIHNRRLAYVSPVVQNYISHLDPKYLFITADQDRHHAPLVGLLYLWDLPFLLLGLYFFFKEKGPNKSKIILVAWFIAAPFAASLTSGVPHSLRTAIYLPVYQIIIAIGVFYSFKYIKFKKSLIFLGSMTLLLNFGFYLHQYYVHLPPEYSKEWLYGRKEAAIYSNEKKNKYNAVIVSTSIEQAYMHWLYYLKYDPKSYQQEGGTASGGFLEERNKFGKFFFRKFDYQAEKPNTLLVGIPSDFPKSVKPDHVIKYLNGEDAIYVVSKEQ